MGHESRVRKKLGLGLNHPNLKTSFRSEAHMTSDQRKLVDWASRALHGLGDSHVFMGILDSHPADAARAEFMLQLGACVMTNKPIVIPVPHGIELPPKLAAIADVVVRYDPENLETLRTAIEHALNLVGATQH